jgi:hypothetical protein
VGLGRVAVAIGVVVLAAGAAAPGDARPSVEPGPILYSTRGDEDDQCGTISSVEPDGRPAETAGRRARGELRPGLVA